MKKEKFLEKKKSDAKDQKFKSGVIKCPRCGEILISATSKCPTCKWTPLPVETQIKPETSETPKAPEGEKLNKCPNCGWVLSAKAVKCPKCKWTKEESIPKIEPAKEISPKKSFFLEKDQKNKEIQLINQEMAKLNTELEEINKKALDNLITQEESMELKNKLFEKLGELQGKLSILQE